MKKIKPMGGRILVTSRGTKEEADGLVIPGQFLRDSNVCTTESGETVVCRDGRGYEAGDHQRIVEENDVIAKIEDGSVTPLKNWVLARKCVDSEDESGIIVSTSKNTSRWVEILAVGPETMLNDCIGLLAFVREAAEYAMQKVEETEADWLIHEDEILMVLED